MIQLLIAGNCPLVRVGISNILSSFNEVSVVNDAALDQDLIYVLDKFMPNVLVLDINLYNNFEQQLLFVLCEHCYPQIKILVLTDEKHHSISDLITIGITGYLSKQEATIENTIRAIYTIASGNVWFSQSMITNLVQPDKVLTHEMKLTDLTKRERQILLMLAQGWSNARIADEMHLAQQTIKNYVSRIYQKLSINSRTEAIIQLKENPKIC